MSARIGCVSTDTFMFDLSNPQKRERFLVIIAGIALCAIVIVVVPAQFREINKTTVERDKLVTNIENHERVARNREAIQSRLAEVKTLALASSAASVESESVIKYQTWLTELAQSAGLKITSSSAPSTSGNTSGIYKRHTFTVEVEGQWDQIAEFLRRFHRAEFLHKIQSFGPRPVQNQPNMIKTTFRVEALSLPQINAVHVPDNDRNAVPITDDERKISAAITERKILWEYTPPAPPQPVDAAPPRFDHAPYCYVNAIVEMDGKPQCWIDLRTLGRKYYLSEGERFMLGTVPSVVKKIEVKSDRVQVAAAGRVFAVRVGKNFDDYDEMCYFFTDILDENGEQWTADSTGEPRCVIVHGSEIEEGDNVRLIKRAKHILSVGETFPMQEVFCMVKAIEPSVKQIQIEAVGATYTIRVGGCFSEFGGE